MAWTRLRGPGQIDFVGGLAILPVVRPGKSHVGGEEFDNSGILLLCRKLTAGLQPLRGDPLISLFACRGAVLAEVGIPATKSDNSLPSGLVTAVLWDANRKSVRHGAIS